MELIVAESEKNLLRLKQIESKAKTILSALESRQQIFDDLDSIQLRIMALLEKQLIKTEKTDEL